MRLIDRIALNKLLTMLSDLIIKILKIFFPTKDKDVDITPDVKPDRVPILPWRRKKKNEEPA